MSIFFCTFVRICGEHAANGGIWRMFSSPELLRKRLSAKEEQVLDKDLAGYTDYKQRVRYRLIPFIW